MTPTTHYLIKREFRTMRTFLALTVIVVLAGCNQGTSEQNEAAQTNVNAAAEASAHQAHENYVAAINSNQLDSILGMLTDDVIFLAANAPVMVGKEEVGPWIEGYLRAFKTHWDKTQHEFDVCGNWAFERYSYQSTDTSLADGSVIEDTGWGLVVYHYDADGKWRVARDAFGPDHPVTQ